MKKNTIYSPVKEQFSVLLEYINIIESKRKPDPVTDISALLELIANISRHCEIYLNYEFLRNGGTVKELNGAKKL